MAKCKHCGETICGTTHNCSITGESYDLDDDAALFDSIIIGAVTDSAILGGLLGGDLLGGVIGDLLDGDLFD